MDQTRESDGQKPVSEGVVVSSIGWLKGLGEARWFRTLCWLPPQQQHKGEMQGPSERHSLLAKVLPGPIEEL